MGTTKQPENANDYALAKLFNNILLLVVQSVREVEALDLPDGYDWKLDELNRVYVLLVYELEELYKQNTKLAEIEPRPFWAKYNILTPYPMEILRFLDDHLQNKGQTHIDQLDRLSIIANSKEPELSPENLKLLEEVLEASKNYRAVLEAAESDKTVLDDEYYNDDAWYIPEYFVSYNNGKIVINDTLYLKKTHIGSTIDQLLEQSFKNPNTLFTPKLPATARNLSTVLSSAGFDPVQRQLFFPKLSSTKGVLFRPTVTFEQVQKDNIDTTKLDLLLKALDPNIMNSR
jgi:phenylalanyl-tRNA synthetase alpha subunit